MKNRVTRPVPAKVARKAKASMTPPNWASTPDAATTTCRSWPFGSPRTTAHARSPPKIAPMIAVPTASWMDLMKALTNISSVNSRDTYSRVGSPFEVTAPIATISVGTMRKSPT